MVKKMRVPPFGIAHANDRFFNAELRADARRRARRRAIAAPGFFQHGDLKALFGQSHGAEGSGGPSADDDDRAMRMLCHKFWKPFGEQWVPGSSLTEGRHSGKKQLLMRKTSCRDGRPDFAQHDCERGA